MKETGPVRKTSVYKQNGGEYPRRTTAAILLEKKDRGKRSECSKTAGERINS